MLSICKDILEMGLSLFGKDGWIVKGEQDSSLWFDERIKKGQFQKICCWGCPFSVTLIL